MHWSCSVPRGPRPGKAPVVSRRTEGRVRRITEGPRLAGAALLPPGAAGTLESSWRWQ